MKNNTNIMRQEIGIEEYLLFTLGYDEAATFETLGLACDEACALSLEIISRFKTQCQKDDVDMCYVRLREFVDSSDFSFTQLWAEMKSITTETQKSVDNEREIQSLRQELEQIKFVNELLSQSCLPCNVNDIVWFKVNDYDPIQKKRVNFLRAQKITKVIIRGEGVEFITTGERFTLEDIDKSVFLSLTCAKKQKW